MRWREGGTAGGRFDSVGAAASAGVTAWHLEVHGVGPDVVVSSSGDGTTRWWAKREGEFATVATFFSNDLALALGAVGGNGGKAVQHSVAVMGSTRGAVLILKFDAAHEAMWTHIGGKDDGGADPPRLIRTSSFVNDGGVPHNTRTRTLRDDACPPLKRRAIYYDRRC